MLFFKSLVGWYRLRRPLCLDFHLFSLFLFFFFFPFLSTQWHMEFSNQGWELSCSCDLNHSCNNGLQLALNSSDIQTASFFYTGNFFSSWAALSFFSGTSSSGTRRERKEDLGLCPMAEAYLLYKIQPKWHFFRDAVTTTRSRPTRLYWFPLF